MKQAESAKQTQLAGSKQRADLKKLRLAVVHDSYLYSGGAERVLESILQIFPQAEIYIPLIKKPYLKKLSQAYLVHTSLFNLIPLPTKYASFLKPLILVYWSQINLDRFDLVISSSHSFSAKSVKTKPPTLHLSYIHTPPRYLYREFNEMSWLKKPFFKLLFSWPLSYLRKKDWQAAQRVDQLIANSKTTQARIKKYYGRTSQVIYPPIKLPGSSVGQVTKPKHYLFHSRLVKQKGVLLVIEAFNKLGKPLLVVGTGPEEKRLKKMANQNIAFLGFVPDHKLARLYAQTKALVYAAIDEDFGLVPAEAMSYGVPVVAFDSGGIKETVVDGKTGLLFDRFSIKSLLEAVEEFERKNWSSKACRQQAKQFSAERFERQLLNLVQTQLAQQKLTKYSL
jgi:glycosyltransferase involved in cell wall biosynthesis